MFTIGADSMCVVAEQRGGVASRLLEQVSRMADEALTERARELAGEISAAEANLAAVMAEVERRGIHSRWECHSVERFAGWHCEMNPSRTKALVAVGRALGELPVLAEAVADGTLSFDKAKAVAKVAAPDTEGALVELAVHATVAQTQRICGAWRKVDTRDVAEQPGDQPGDAAGVTDDPRPTVVVFRDDDGIEITCRFDHVRGELVLASIDAEARQARREREVAAVVDPAQANDPHGRPACDEDRPIEKLSTAEWRAEGLLRLAERSATEQPEGVQASGFATTVVVHVGIDTLYGPDLPDPDKGDRHGDPPPERAEGRPSPRLEMAELEPAGVRVRRDVARWLACDAGLLTVIDDTDGNPLHLGPRKNPIPASLRRAVMARHRHCAWPGCTATAVQMHHLHHRRAGGHDDVEALVFECFTHHRTIHLHGVWITIDDHGGFHHWRPDGTEILANPHTGRDPGPDALTAPDTLAQRRLALGADPAETARQPRWHGDVLLLGDAIDAVLARRHLALRRTQPTKTPPAPRYGPTPPNPN